MELDQLIYFAKVAELEHMSKAAEELNISQPALSVSIRKLEDELGIRFFERKGRNIVLNTYGKIFLDFARPTIQEFQKVKAQLDELEQKENSRVRISMPPVYSFPNLQKHLHEAFPDILIELKSGRVSEMFDLLRANEIDFCIIGAMLCEDSHIHTQTITDDAMVMIMRADHAMAAQGEARLVQFAQEDFVNFSRPSGTDATTTDVEYYCRKAGFQPRIVFQAPIMYEIINAVRNGMGVSLVPQRTLPQYDLTGLATVHITDPECYTHLRMYWLKDQQERRAVVDVRNFIIQYFMGNQ